MDLNIMKKTKEWYDLLKDIYLLNHNYNIGNFVEMYRHIEKIRQQYALESFVWELFIPQNFINTSYEYNRVGSFLFVLGSLKSYNEFIAEKILKTL